MAAEAKEQTLSEYLDSLPPLQDNPTVEMVLERRIMIARRTNILDLGCGTGLWGLLAAHIVEGDCWLTLTDVHAPSGECGKQKAQGREYGDVLT